MTEIQTQTESQDLSEAEIKQSAIAIIHDLLTVKGLYFRQEITSSVGEMVNILLRRELSIGYDSYCVGCKKESVFRLSPKPMSAGTTGGRFQGVAVPPDIFAIKTVCQRILACLQLCVSRFRWIFGKDWANSINGIYCVWRVKGIL